jgi:hypothetical protein
MGKAATPVVFIFSFLVLLWIAANSYAIHDSKKLVRSPEVEYPEFAYNLGSKSAYRIPSDNDDLTNECKVSNFQMVMIYFNI